LPVPGMKRIPPFYQYFQSLTYNFLQPALRMQ